MINYFQCFQGPVYPSYYTYPGFILPPQTPPSSELTQTPQIQQTPQKKYNVVNDEKRELLVKLIEEEHYTLKSASEYLQIKLSTSKAIMKIFKTQGRITKVKQRKKKTMIKKPKQQKQQDPIEQLRKQLPKLSQEYLNYMNPNVQIYGSNVSNIKLE